MGRQEPPETHELQIIVPFTPQPPPEGEGTDAIDYATREERPLLAMADRAAEIVTDFLESLRTERKQLQIGRAKLALAENEIRSGRRMTEAEKGAFVAGVLATLDIAEGWLEPYLDDDDDDDEGGFAGLCADRAGLRLHSWLSLDDEDRAFMLMRDTGVQWSGLTWQTTHADSARNREALSRKPKPWDHNRWAGERVDA